MQRASTVTAFPHSCDSVCLKQHVISYGRQCVINFQASAGPLAFSQLGHKSLILNAVHEILTCDQLCSSLLCLLESVMLFHCFWYPESSGMGWFTK